MGTLGDRVRKRREQTGMTQRKLAKQADVTYAYISRIESGDRTPSWRAAARIAEALGTTGLFLWTGDESTRCPFCGRGDHYNG